MHAGTYQEDVNQCAWLRFDCNAEPGVNPVVTSTTDTTICSNNLPFVWNGTSYNAAGSYQKTLVSHLDAIRLRL